MTNLNDLLDQVPELEKRVYALKLLSEVDITALSGRDLNNWIGLLFDSVDLLEQSVSDMRTLSRVISSCN